MKNVVNVGLIGFGTVGSGLYSLIKSNNDKIVTRTGITLNIKSICDLRVDDVKKSTEKIYVTDDFKEIINDSEIDTIVELIGGIEPAKTIILEALKAGKNVVTANKKLLAEAGDEIFETANNGNAKLGFEAAIGGGIPCVDALKNSLVGNKVQSVMGILNGTTNYILTRMDEAGLSFDTALKEAQEEGFAEADPTFDIEGFDAGHKISLLAMLAYNKKVNYKDVPIEGITKIQSIDIDNAKEMGYAIKLLGICKEVGDSLDIRVHPTMIKEEHPLASVRNEFNAVMYDNDMTGPIILYGKGAGSLPTASAVAGDIVQIALKNAVQENAITLSGESKILPADKILSRYYFRMQTEDSTGILEKISGVLSRNNISISSVVQHEGQNNIVPLVIVTHMATEAGIQKSIEEINNFDFVKEPIMMIRVAEADNLKE
jgi:homoserine dehydrogenase